MRARLGQPPCGRSTPRHALTRHALTPSGSAHAIAVRKLNAVSSLTLRGREGLARACGDHAAPRRPVLLDARGRQQSANGMQISKELYTKQRRWICSPPAPVKRRSRVRACWLDVPLGGGSTRLQLRQLSLGSAAAAYMRSK